MVSGDADAAPNETHLSARHVAFLDIDRLYFELERFKAGSWSTCHASPQDISLAPFRISTSYSTTESLSRYMYPYSIMLNIHAERFVDAAEDLRGRTYAKADEQQL